MIDLNFLRERPEIFAELIKKKDPAFDVQKLYNFDQIRRSLLTEIETVRAEKNDLARQAKSGVTEEIRKKSSILSDVLKDKEKALEAIELDFKELYLRCPNIPLDDVPQGNKEENVVVKKHGNKPAFNFPIKNHVDLGTALGWINFSAGAVMTGSQFPVYQKGAVNLVYALTRFMLRNNIKHGFEPVLPPYLVNEATLEASGNLPKFRDQVYSISDDNLFLSPTSEVNLVGLHKDTIMAYEELPKRYTSWTACFRREAGGYGSAERGLIRIHQFDKVELYTLCSPEKSNQEQERMLACAEDILQQLGLHYRVSLLAGQDCSFQSARTYDVEVWLPEQQEYKEVSSISNCTDFQARRAKMRYREKADFKPELVHTLNGSSLAIPRLLVAIMETYQQSDGTIEIPDILKNEGIF